MMLSPSTCLLSQKSPTPAPMPSQTPPKRNWRKVDKGALLQLIVDGKVDIEDHSHKNIDSVHERWFSTHLKRNFWRNFKDYATSFDLKRALAGAR